MAIVKNTFNASRFNTVHLTIKISQIRAILYLNNMEVLPNNAWG